MSGVRRWLGKPSVVVAGLTAVLAVPLLVALAVLHDPAWFPHGDLAMIEMRVRDVASSHPPLVGLVGRLEGYGVGGSHPGPLSFYAMWPMYQLFGADGWGLQVASVVLVLAATALSLMMAYRRGGWTFAIAVGAMLALLMRGYGSVILVQPWNPQLPVMWWIVFLLAVWSVLCDDLRMLPLAVVAGSMCTQTHVPYTGIVAGVGLLLAGYLGFVAIRQRDDGARRSQLLRWGGGSAALAVLLWLPPMIDQVRNDPGNLSIIVENFRHPYDEQVSFGTAVEGFFAHLNIWELVNSERAITGSAVPGILLLVVWAGAAALALWQRQAVLLKLHAVVGCATAFGLVSMTRIFGQPWNYLTLWAWGTTALMALAICWTVLSFAGRRATDEPDAEPSLPPLRWVVPTASVLGAAGLVLVGLSVDDAAYAEMPNREMGDDVHKMTTAVVAALEDDPAGCGDRCKYHVTAEEALTFGFEEPGLLLALEREGVSVSAETSRELDVRPHRVGKVADADARIHAAVGDLAIDRAAQEPGGQQLARFGSTRQQQEELSELRQEITDRLEAAGLSDVAARVAEQEMISVDPAMPADVVQLVRQANRIPRSRAVFLINP